VPWKTASFGLNACIRLSWPPWDKCSKTSTNAAVNGGTIVHLSDTRHWVQRYSRLCQNGGALTAPIDSNQRISVLSITCGQEDWSLRGRNSEDYAHLHGAGCDTVCTTQREPDYMAEYDDSRKLVVLFEAGRALGVCQG
jgi:hypothetical protein